MAWQLIYTSAPRLLEAGRSGFGTVARHRAIPNLLVGAIERISQFSRLPGLADHRIIYSHRHISVSGIRFHVISRISDAGADYTGRTNHIAHHLIVDPKEIANSPVTPADVLLFFAWKTGWRDLPCYLDAAEEVSLGSIQRRVRLPASCWGHVVGNKRYAALLVGSEVSRGCSLVYTHDPNSDPSQQLAIHLFGESLLLTGERKWSFPFTTNLQPSDDAADFLWSGVWSNSPVRNQIEQRERAIFTLALGGVARNGSSRQILVPTGAAADLAETGRTAMLVEPTPRTAAVPAAVLEYTIPEQQVIPKPSESTRTTQIVTAIPQSNASTRHLAAPAPRRWNLWVPAAAVLVLLIAIFSVFGYYRIGKWWQTSQDQKNAVLDSLSDVPQHTDSDVDELINEPGGYNEDQIRAIKDLATKWRAALATTAGSKCIEIDQDCRVLQNLDKPESVRALVARIRGWLDLRAKVLNDSVTNESYDEYAALCTEINNEDPNPSLDNIRDNLLQCDAEKRCDFLLAELNTTMQPPYQAAWFLDKLTAIKKNIPQNPDSTDTELSDKVDQLDKIIALWDALEKSKTAGSPTDDLKKDQFHENDNTPEWLKTAREDFITQHSVKAFQATGEQVSKGPETIAQASWRTDEDAVKNGTKTIYMVVGDEGLASLDLNFDSHALQQLSLTKNGTPYPLARQDKYFKAGAFWFRASDDGKLEHVDSIGAGGKQPSPPFTLEGQIPSSTAEFQIRVLGSDPGNDKETKPLKFTGGLVIVEHDYKHQIILDKPLEKLCNDLILPAEAKLELPPGFDPYAEDNLKKTLPFQNYVADVQFVDDLDARRMMLESKLEKTSPAAAVLTDPFEGFPPDSSQTNLSIKERASLIFEYLNNLTFEDPKYKAKVLGDSKVQELSNISGNDWNVLYGQIQEIYELLPTDEPDPSNKRTDEDVTMLKTECAKWPPILGKCKTRIDALARPAVSASEQTTMKAELDKLKTIPLLNGKLPGGTYTVMVMGDDGSETSLIEFEIPNL